MDLAAVLLNGDEVGYVTHVLDQHFGPICARIAALMLTCGASSKFTLRDLMLYVNDPKWDSAGPTLVIPKVSSLQLRAALVVLLQHQCIVPMTREAADGKITYHYRASVEGIVSRGRFAHYLDVIAIELGDLAAHILSEVLQNGSICTDAFSVPDGNSQADVDQMVTELRRRKFLRVVDLDPMQRKTVDFTDESRTSAVGANFRVLNLLIAKGVVTKVVEDHLGPASGLVFSALFEAAVSIKDDELQCAPQAVQDIAPLVQRHFSTEDVANCLREMQRETCLAGIVVSQGKEVVEKRSVSADVSDVAAGGTRSKRSKTPKPPPQKVQTVESKITVEAFNVDWKAVRRKLQYDFSRMVVRQQIGTQAARVYALLDDNCEKMFEVDQITEHCLLTKKDVCTILNQLSLMNLVFWQEVPKGQHSAQCTPANVPNYGAGIWVYQTNRGKCAVNFRSMVAKGLHNLMLRFKDEVEGRAKIPPKMDRVALDSAQDILERTFLQLQLSYLALRDI